MSDTAGSSAPARHAYEVLGSDARTIPTRALAWSCVAAMSGYVLFDVVVAATALRRRAAWDAAFDSNADVDIARALDVEERLRSLRPIGWLVVVPIVVTLTAWTFLVLGNAQRRGVTVRRRAAFAWLLPILGSPAAIMPLTHAVGSFDYSERRLRMWLFAMYVNLPLVFLLTLSSSSAFNTITDAGAAIDALERDVQITIAMTFLVLVWAVLGCRAVLHADRAITGSRRRR